MNNIFYTSTYQNLCQSVDCPERGLFSDKISIPYQEFEFIES